LIAPSPRTAFDPIGTPFEPVPERRSVSSNSRDLFIIGRVNRDLLVKILLWYNVLSLGVWAGGTVYQMAVIVPMWSASPPESVRAFFQGSAYTTTIGNFFGPVTQVARALPLFILVAAASRYANVRPWIVACAATMAFGLVMTRAYIYPMNAVLFEKAGGDLSADAIRALVHQWIFADRVRFAIMTSGYLCLLRAFSLPLAART
jgi:hypothetical protein